MEKLAKKSFSINLKVMTALHLYSSKTTRLHKVCALIIYFLFSFHVPLLGSLYFLLEKDINIERVSDNAFVLAEVVSCFFKLLPFITNGNKIRRCIHHLEAPVFQVFNNQQQAIVNTCIDTCRRNSRIFFVLLLSGYTLWSIKPLLLGDHRWPIDVWLPVNVNNKTISFYFVYFYLIVGVGYPGLGSAAIDPLIGGLPCLVTGQLKILKDNLEFLSENAEELEQIVNQMPNSKIFTKSEIIYEKIKQSVKHHNAILNFVEEYEECFSPIVFSQLVGSSNALTNSIYMGNWYEYDIKSRKALITLMERSKIPMKVTAGKILDLSLETFTTLY
ncbi:7tm 6 domain containing protein [Asbolus verrucosus]|uniref:7tm 6 domain containing protein n=1 Tax=Asbolus verrucosus TaxID=1661398 RepID=A0A482W9A2_ASBVE|nr:7tm 6 domain containing protein [Asbolus verrucosus]